MPDTPVYISTSFLKNVPLGDALRWCEENRLFHIELSGPHPFEPVEKIRGLLAAFRKKGFAFTVHNYFPPPRQGFVLNIASFDNEVSLKSRILVEQALELGEAAASPVYGLHSGYLADAEVDPKGMFVFKDRKYDASACCRKTAEFITGLNKRVRNGKTAIILENLFPAEDGNFSLACTLEEIKELMSLLPQESGLLLDLAHLNISSVSLGFDKFSFLKGYLAAFGERLLEVHISDNSGFADEHLPLAKESWQLRALKEISSAPCKKGFNRIYCLEVRNAADTASLLESRDLVLDSLSRT